MKKSFPPIFLQIPNVGAPFRQKTRVQIVQKTLPHSPIEHHTTKTKSLRIHLTDHRSVHFGPAQQPANNKAALV
jgi:hypothetical protein